MKLSETLYGKEIFDSMKKSNKRHKKMVVGLCLLMFAILAGFAYLFYKEGELEQLRGWGPVILGGVMVYFFVILSLTLSRTPEKILKKSINKNLQTEELKKWFAEELNQKPSCILKLGKKSGKVLFTKHFVIQYNENSVFSSENLRILRLDDMDSVLVTVMRNYGIDISYSHRYEKREQPKCVQHITFRKESDSDAFLNQVCMLRPQLEVKN